ncbi:hypothetical protein KAX17_13805 [Candidatus Bipolaricaulota bacterium]|nr:hypothetical protein [Candidatus Bipolaricaulota bacterium]
MLESRDVVYWWDGARELQRTTIAAIFGRYTKPPTSFGTEEEAMVTEKVDGLAWLRKQVEAADKDLLKSGGSDLHS